MKNFGDEVPFQTERNCQAFLFEFGVVSGNYIYISPDTVISTFSLFTVLMYFFLMKILYVSYEIFEHFLLSKLR